MDVFIPNHLLDLLTYSATVSVVLMTLIQKFKTLPFVNKVWKVWLLNFFLSFALGLSFAICFFDLDWIEGIWISIFSFIGAPTLFDLLRTQNIINYKPSTLTSNSSPSIKISTDNEIKRE